MFLSIRVACEDLCLDKEKMHRSEICLIFMMLSLNVNYRELFANYHKFFCDRNLRAFTNHLRTFALIT